MVNDIESGTRVRPWVSTKSKLIVILLVVLIMSSGSLYYIDTPIFYYGFLGFSVMAILIVIYLMIYLTHGAPELFSSDRKGAEDDDSEIISSGVEKVLKAEQKFNRKTQRATKKSKTQDREGRGTKIKAEVDKSQAQNIGDKHKEKDKGKRKRPKETKKIETLKKHAGIRKSRLGSVPIEESIFKERIKVQTEKSKKNTVERKDKVTTFICPSCGGRELYYEAGLVSGYKYHCKDCDYIGSFVIEKDFKVDS